MKTTFQNLCRTATLAAILGSIPSWSFVSEETKSQMHQELNFIANVYRTQYAPRFWKEKTFSWNLLAETDLAHQKIDAAETIFDSRKAVVDFLNSTKDYHVGYRFISTESSSLPLQLKTLQDKTYIAWIDRSKLSEQVFPFHPGDQILSMNDKPIADVRAELAQYLGNNVSSTDQSLVDLRLTARTAAKNIPVPRGPVLFSIEKQSDHKVVQHQLIWEYTPEQIPGFLSKKTIQSTNTAKSGYRFSSPMMVSPQVDDLTARSGFSAGSFGLGERNSFLPNFGPRIWETPSTAIFDAYIYANPQGKLIGVVRIPGYIQVNYNESIKEFASIIQHMQKITSALVIDQLNNPGGSVFYLYTLASMLTETSLTTPRHRMGLNPAGAAECVQLLKQLEPVKNEVDAKKLDGGEDLNGYPASYSLVAGMRDFCQFYLREYQEGKKFSDPYHVWGIDRINASQKASYTKPIFVLVNELDFSGGDFFPAILQDNRRATIVGTRTSGAGGYVNRVQIPNSFGLELFSFTGSIAERVDLNPIENLGIRPDVDLPFTPEDLGQNFQHYISEVQNLIQKKLNP